MNTGWLESTLCRSGVVSGDPLGVDTFHSPLHGEWKVSTPTRTGNGSIFSLPLRCFHQNFLRNVCFIGEWVQQTMSIDSYDSLWEQKHSYANLTNFSLMVAILWNFESTSSRPSTSVFVQDPGDQHSSTRPNSTLVWYGASPTLIVSTPFVVWTFPTSQEGLSSQSSDPLVRLEWNLPFDLVQWLAPRLLLISIILIIAEIWSGND